MTDQSTDHSTALVKTHFMYPEAVSLMGWDEMGWGKQDDGF